MFYENFQKTSRAYVKRKMNKVVRQYNKKYEEYKIKREMSPKLEKISIKVRQNLQNSKSLDILKKNFK